MKKILALCFFISFFTTNSQSKGDVIMNWTEKNELSFGTYKINVPQFSGENFNYNTNKKAIEWVLKLVDSNIYDESSIQITNVVFENISAGQIGDLSIENIPSQLTTSIKSKNSRDLIQSFLYVSPIIKDDFGFKKLMSFSYLITPKPLSAKNTSQTKKTTGTIVNSVLASGDWYRFYVQKSGVYRINKNFLQDLGINLTGINPKKIRLFGNGGRMVPLANKTFYPNDLAENAIQVFGENDGVFNDNDYILFYAEGTDIWNTESKTSVNLFDTKSYYYINIQGEDGKRIAEAAQPNGASSLNMTTFEDTEFHEIDLYNLANIGRRWFGESFEIKNSQEFEFNFPNIDTSIPVELQVEGASISFGLTSFSVEANNVKLGDVNFSRLTDIYGETKFNEGVLSTSFTGSPTIKIKLNYNNNGVAGSKGYLDFIKLKAQRQLSGYGKQFLFENSLSQNNNDIGSYSISNANSISQVWDVTDIYNVRSYINQGQNVYSFKTNLGSLGKYVAIDNADFYVPLKENTSRVTNQNLKGTIFKNNKGEFQDIDYVIVTPEFLYNQAEKLAQFHRSNSNLNTKVITLESIYKEFSSGKQDVAGIRNCIRYIYQNASSDEKRIKYLNLFGDASFDYKNIIANNTNIVPIYQALSSNTVGENSYCTDDFYCYMDEDEGDVTNHFGGIDIAVGRMILSDVSKADEMVNKVIEYYNQQSYGNWRNNCALVSDDSDKPTDISLQVRQNNLADAITAKKPFINIQKILMDSYIQETSAGGSRYPKARTDLFEAFEKGALMVNYLGHGNEDGLTGERMWEKPDGTNLKNQFRYPLFITMTCDFSRFDNPLRTTAGEYAYWNPKGGVIAMLTTIRTINQSRAQDFNDVITNYLLSFDGKPQTSIAEALRLAKNSSHSSSSNVIVCIGDPAIMLAIPKPKIKLTKINDVAIDKATDNFSALSKMKITGQVTDDNDAVLSNYSGEVFVKIFDKNVQKKTLNNDGYSPSINFTDSGETIFRGNASVTNGQFELSFIVPRDIRIPVGNGKISFYAKKTNQLEDKTGHDTSIKIGGINQNAPTDNINPNLKLYMNDVTFVSGGITNSSPYILAHLEDESGINTASGIGHDLIAILDGNLDNPYVLNDYYQTNLDDFTKGSLRFPLRNISPGLHTLTVKAWDVYNNPITAEIQFLVVSDESITLTNVLNYPNPFVNYTEFWFTHNKPSEPLEVQVQVYTVTGKVVWTKNQVVTTTGFLSKEITWDGKDDFGNKIGKGVYVYKLTVKATLSNKKTEKIEKIVIL